MRDRRAGMTVVYRSLSRWDLDLICGCDPKAIVRLWQYSLYGCIASVVLGYGWIPVVLVVVFVVIQTRTLADLGKSPYGYEIQARARAVSPVLRRGGRAFAVPPPGHRG